ncbi:MAG TPA: FkbM family methyltransferase [Candidatus Acidoferrum sp.]|nr:FkbM family methyltransferase [Candidatus Acidoferrum sp.]
MATSSPRVAKAFLRYASPFSKLRTIPVFGGLLRKTSRALVALDTLVWVQIEQGPGAGLWVCVNARTGRHVLRGEAEPRVQEALMEHLQPGMTFYDLGANIGFFSLLAGRFVGPTGHLCVFEPDPVMFERLRLNLARNGIQAIAERKAVWSQTTEVPFACADVTISCDRGLGHVATDCDLTESVIRVEGISLDDFCNSHQTPDFIKCDVEGAEYEVFRGASEVLRRAHPTIVCEMHSTENHFALTRYFLDLGYRCSLLGENHVLAVFN